MKKRLHRNPTFKLFAILVAAGIAASFYVISYWAFALWFLAAFFLDIPSSYFLTNDYIQKGNTKLLFSEIDDVRSFLWWHILIDCHDDTIWIASPFLDRDSWVALSKHLGISLAEQGAAANP